MTCSMPRRNRQVSQLLCNRVGGERVGEEGRGSKMSFSSCYGSVLRPRTETRILPSSVKLSFVSRRRCSEFSRVRASAVDSYESSPDFAKRMEQAWLISQQPRPITCSSCHSKGVVDCKWCAGTGFFILGDNMLCQVPSKNTSCVICSGKGSTYCSDCKGTGFRAKWLGQPPPIGMQ